MAAGGPVPGRGRFHDVLAAPHVPWRRVLEVPRHSPFVGRCGLDLGGALSPRQPAVRHHRGRCRAADGRHFAGRDAPCSGRSTSSIRRSFTPTSTGRSARSNMSWRRRCFIAGTTLSAPRAATPILPAPFRSGTSCSVPSGCRKACCPSSMAWRASPRFPARSSANWSIRSANSPCQRRICCRISWPICPLFMNCRQIHRVGRRLRCVSPLPAS